MKLNYLAIRLIEFLMVLSMVGFSIYSLLSNKIYNLAILSLEAFIQIEVLSTIYPLLPILPILILFTISLYLYALGRPKHLDRVYAISWLIHLPSILRFSQIDWLQALGLPINFQTLETKLSFTETLIISIILVAGRILLFYTSQIRETYLELLGRGAEKDDLRRVLSGMMMFALLFVGSSAAAVLALGYLIPLVKILLNPIITLLPYPYIVVGVICLIMIPLCIILYLHSGAND